ncbi:MAG: phosphate ABC transporter permease PstA [Ktedonobacteraceae bacterium]|nr:phosphate ABC transporter permease PstA [Ktedonobacteraceae bacterium]
MKAATANPFQPAFGRRELRRRVMTILTVVLTGLFACLAIAFLIYLIWYVAQQGIQFLNIDFFTLPPSPIGDVGGGVVTAIVGSLLIVGLASLIGVPLGLLTGIYLAEFGRGPLASALRFLVDMLAGIPTIIFGLFIWILVVVPLHTFSGLAGGLALAIIMIPTVTRTTEEVLRLVPQELREASAALGATTSRTIVRVVVPAASSGIVTGIFLAIARVAGETAPLLMTAFGSPFFNTDLSRPMDALPLRVFTFTLSPYEPQIHQAYAGSFVLLCLVILASLAIRWATGGFRHR